MRFSLKTLMHSMVFFAVVASLAFVMPAYADQSQAREVARLNNCTPNKIEIYSQKMASDIQTVYRVGCNVPKVVGTNAGKVASALLVRCNGSLCQLLRPLLN